MFQNGSSVKIMLVSDQYGTSQRNVGVTLTYSFLYIKNPLLALEQSA